MAVSASAFSIASAAGCINGQWNGAETGSRTPRLMPQRSLSSFTIATARSIAPLWPEITTWVGSLSFATVQISPSASAASARSSALATSAPSSAAIAPSPTGTARCIACPRNFSSRAVSPSGIAPAAHSALYSPSECPATQPATSDSFTPPSFSSTRSTAMDSAMIAGWAFSVSISSFAGPSFMSANSFWPSASSTSSNSSRAWGLAAARSAPMPTFWLPCPGKMNARIARPVRSVMGAVG